MKITIFGLTISSSWGNGHATPYRALLKALHAMGHEVVFYEKDVPYYAQRRDFSDWRFCTLRLYQDWRDIRSQALEDMLTSDVVMNASYCPDGELVCDEALNIGGPLHVFYDLDTPITLSALAQGPVEYLRADQIPAFDLYLSFTGGAILKELENRWHAQQALPLYGCVDPDIYVRVAKRPEYECTLSYMGTFAEDRQHKLNEYFLEPARKLSQDGFILGGSLYPASWQWPENVRRFEHVAPANHPAFYSSSQFTLNITRESMARQGYCPSGRFFEAAACGTAIISDWFTGLDEFFTPDSEILIAQDASDVVHTLSYPAQERRLLGKQARQRTLDEHTGMCRARELMRYFEAAMSPQHSRMEAA